MKKTIIKLMAAVMAVICVLSIGLTAFAAEAIITKEEATAIALEYAGFTAEQVRHLRVEYEIDDGRQEYNISFVGEHREYDFEINAVTGDIVDYDVENTWFAQLLLWLEFIFGSLFRK